MRTDWIPALDTDLDDFQANFNTKITATPTAYGLVAGDATAFAVLATAFTAALVAATNPATRTAVTVATKQTARVVLVASLRSLAKRIQAYAAITPTLLTGLGLTVRDTTPTRIVAPSSKPVCNVFSINSRRHTINIVDEATPLQKARPFGASACLVFSFTPTAAEDAPGDIELWRFEGLATKFSYDVTYAAGEVGKLASIRTQWVNRRGERGPLSDVITATVAA